ncbi:uncharacterized protein LOC120891624 [Ictidomys tridecemlineatus]
MEGSGCRAVPLVLRQARAALEGLHPGAQLPQPATCTKGTALASRPGCSGFESDLTLGSGLDKQRSRLSCFPLETGLTRSPPGSGPVRQSQETPSKFTLRTLRPDHQQGAAETYAASRAASVGDSAWFLSRVQKVPRPNLCAHPPKPAARAPRVHPLRPSSPSPGQEPLASPLRLPDAGPEQTQWPSRHRDHLANSVTGVQPPVREPTRLLRVGASQAISARSPGLHVGARGPRTPPPRSAPSLHPHYGRSCPAHLDSRLHCPALHPQRNPAEASGLRGEVVRGWPGLRVEASRPP